MYQHFYPVGATVGEEISAVRLRRTEDRDNTGQGRFGAGAHVNMRNPSRGLIGLFGGLGSVDADQDDTANVLWGGAEGQLYINMLTLYGQIGAVDSDNSHDSLDFSHLFARGVLRYYVNPNWVIEGEASYTQGIIHSDAMDAIGWGAKTKFGLGTSPFVAYNNCASIKMTGFSSRIELFNRPLASFGVAGMITFKPGTWQNQDSRL